MDIIKKFLESGKSGIYFKVVKEGEIGVDDPIKLIKKDKNDITIKHLVDLVTKDKENTILMENVVKVQDLPQGWKYYFLEHFNKYDLIDSSSTILIFSTVYNVTSIKFI